MAFSTTFLFDFVPFLVMLYLAGEIYFRNPGNVMNRSASLQFILAGSVFLGEWMVQSLPLPLAFGVGHGIKYGGSFAAMSVSVYFFIRLAEARLHRGWTVALSAVPLAAIGAMLLLPETFAVDYEEKGYYKVEHVSYAMDQLMHAFSVYTLVIVFLMLMLARKRLRQYYRLVQSRKFTPIVYALSLSFVWIAIFMTMPEHTFPSIPQLPSRMYPAYSFLIWAIGVRYAMVKFNFLPSPERKYQILFRLSTHGIVMLDRHARIVEVNPAFERMLGKAEPELKGTYFDSYVTEEEQDLFCKQYHIHFQEIRPLRRELSIVGAGGQTIVTEAESDFLVLEEGMLQYVLLRNITERKRSEAKIRHMAYYDELTELPNRHLFHERMQDALQRIGTRSTQSAVLLLGLDRFKLINDTLGHSSGDTLLRYIADKLQACCGETATIARLGGDEFAVLLPSVAAEQDAADTAERLMAALQKPIPLGDMEFFVTVSIGISLAPEDGKTPNDLLRAADMAMNAAKQSGRNRHSRFSSAWNETNERSLAVVNGLRHALAKGEFVLYYQPQVSMKTRTVVGAEALIRWNRDGRTVGPNEFIPAAEDTGLIVPIGDWALETALRDWFRWGRPNGDRLKLSVNLSPKQVLDSGFVERLRALLQRMRFPPEALCLEVTESIAIHDTGLALSVCRAIRELGVQLAIDDFGTGYSSLSALHSFPFTEMKLDRSFIGGVGQEDRINVILRTMLDLSSSLCMDVVAEGVETPEQWRLLQELGCETAQGYLISRPLPAADFELFLAQGMKAVL